MTTHPFDRLTARQLQVVELLGDGLTNSAIGRRLGLSESSVKTYTSEIYVALNMSRDASPRVAVARLVWDRERQTTPTNGAQ